MRAIPTRFPHFPAKLPQFPHKCDPGTLFFFGGGACQNTRAVQHRSFARTLLENNACLLDFANQADIDNSYVSKLEEVAGSCGKNKAMRGLSMEHGETCGLWGNLELGKHGGGRAWIWGDVVESGKCGVEPDVGGSVELGRRGDGKRGAAEAWRRTSLGLGRCVEPGRRCDDVGSFRC